MIYSNSITKTVERSIESFRGNLTNLTNVGKRTVVLTFSDQIDPYQIESLINNAKNSWKVSRWDYLHSDSKPRQIKFFCNK